MRKMEKLQGKRAKFYTEIFEAFNCYKIYHFPTKDIVIREKDRFIRVNPYKAEKTPRCGRTALQEIAVAVTSIFWASLFETSSSITHCFK